MLNDRCCALFSHTRELKTVFGKHWIMQRSTRLIFWGYESGNLLAAITGVGGIVVVLDALSASREASCAIKSNFWCAIDIATTFPSILAVLSLQILVLVGPFVRKVAWVKARSWRVNLSDVFWFVLAIALVIYAFDNNSSWVTAVSIAFVLASAFLKLGYHSAFYLKIGALLCQLGGFCMFKFGLVTLAMQHGLGNDPASIAMAVLTCISAYYVYSAGVFTYVGGIRATEPNKVTSQSHQGVWLDIVVDKMSMSLVKLVDPVSLFQNKYTANPAVFWVSAETKQTLPLATSMYIRVPWRFLSGGAAIATGSEVGFAFALANLCWAIGDIAVGSKDWKLDKPVQAIAGRPRESYLDYGRPNSYAVSTISRMEKVKLKNKRFQPVRIASTRAEQAKTKPAKAEHPELRRKRPVLNLQVNSRGLQPC